MTCGDCVRFTIQGFFDECYCQYPRVSYRTIVYPDSPGCNAFRAKGNPARQPAPVPNGLPRVHDLVLTDLEGRLAQGLRTYGVPLQPHNGRDALTDAYHEALDLALYLRQAIFERDGK